MNQDAKHREMNTETCCGFATNVLAAPKSVVLCLFATVEELSNCVVHIRFSTATVDDRWESEYLAASQAAAGMIPFGDKICDKYLRCIIDISVIPSGSDTMFSHIYNTI